MTADTSTLSCSRRSLISFRLLLHCQPCRSSFHCEISRLSSSSTIPFQFPPVSSRSPNLEAVITFSSRSSSQVPHPFGVMNKETIDLRLYKYNPSFVPPRCLTGRRQCAFLVGNEPVLVHPRPAIRSPCIAV